MNEFDLNKPIQYNNGKGRWLDCELLDSNFNSGGLILRAYKATQESGNQFICYLDPENIRPRIWRNKPKPKIKVGVIVFKNRHEDLFSIVWQENSVYYPTRESVLKSYNMYTIVFEFEKEIEID